MDEHEFQGEYPAYAESRAGGTATHVCMTCAEDGTRSQLRAPQKGPLPTCPSCGRSEWWKL